ncbi:MAG: PH domain-containing protein [Planctomycetes bacterium]|nr:PH domain-containing protein [Planctomycetota bacterium]
MTDASDAGAPPAAPPVDAPVLARGHLHPLVLLLRLLDSVQQVLFLVVAALVTQQPWLLVVAGVMFLVRLGTALARYLTLEYTLTGEELRIREGILERQERRIPLDRIQDLGFESTILRRVLGLTVVLVETASGRGVEARLDALSRQDADHLREVLLEARRTRLLAAPTPATGEGAPATPQPEPEPEPEYLVHRSSTSDLLLRGLTDLRLSAFVVTGFAALQLAEQLGFATQLQGLAGTVRQWLGQFSPLVLVALLVSLLLAVMAFGIATATLGNLVQFHGFSLTLRGTVLQRRFGLLTTRSKTLPLERIQRVTVEQPWLRRLLGLAVVKADSAGGSRAQGEDNAGGWDVVVPLAKLPVTDEILPALLPGIEATEFSWRRGSPLLVLRTTLQGAILATLAVAAFWSSSGAGALLALLLIPTWFVLGILTYRNLGLAVSPRFFALRHGIVGRYLAYVPTAKVQAVVVQQGPLALLLGLAEMTIYVAGGSPTRVPNLTIGDARQVAHEVAALAATAAAADW